MPNIIGQTLGRYHILEQLGEGGMAVVYKAFDTRLERNVAVKIILPGKQHSEKFLKRFEREAKSLASLSHPNIVKVIDYGEHEGLPYLVMEYIPGGTLKSKLNGKSLPWRESAKILVPIARALSYAHEQKIIHRDIKPANILITQSGEPMLSDFGIAKILEVEETLDLTGTGVGVGTPEYMSPEQAQGKLVDARADVYSLGVVFYEMVTGRKPYQADTPMAVVWKLASEPLPRPRNFIQELPEMVEQVLLKALAKSPDDRFLDMGALITALENLIAGEFHGKGIKPAGGKRNPKLIIGLSVIGVLLIMAAFIAPGLFSNFQSPRETSTAVPQAAVVPTGTNLVDPGQEKTFLVMEDFEDGKIQIPDFSAQQGWGIVDDEFGNKVFQIDDRNGKDYVGFSFGADEWQNYVTEYRVRYLNNQGSIGLQVRSDGTNYYVIDLDPGELYLAYPTPSEWVRMATKFPPVPINTWHTVRVEVQGESIQVFIDNARWISENDSKYRNGGAMVFASPGTYAQVDDIKVWEGGKTQSNSNHEQSTTDGSGAMLLIPAGEFSMGSSQGAPDEKPVHRVTLDQFWMDATEVTNSLYHKCVTAGACQSTDWCGYDGFDGPQQPVVCVNWNMAKTYCEWAGKRLPTEAEWEKAARGTDERIFPWGDAAPNGDLLNFNGDLGSTINVGSYPKGASPYGILDMAGNVWEWVEDWHSNTYYQNSPKENPKGPAIGKDRVFRGGWWGEGDSEVHTYHRKSFSPDLKDLNTGIRCAKSTAP